MKRKKKPSFTIVDKRVPRWTVAVLAMAKKLDPAGAPRPTGGQIAALAFSLARENHDLDRSVEEFFHWPASAPPCRDARVLYLPLVEKYKKMAEERLRQHYAYYHALAVRRKRWLRAHPRPRGWAWTQKPLTRGVPPARKRNYRHRPPRLAYPDTVSPPPSPLPEDSPKHPGRREREILLCFSRLFGNRIAVYRHALKIRESVSLISIKRGAIGIDFPKSTPTLVYTEQTFSRHALSRGEAAAPPPFRNAPCPRWTTPAACP